MTNRELSPNRCQKWVYGERDVWGRQCANKPVIERDGNPYCKIHDPQYVEAKRKAANDESEKQYRKRQMAWALDHARRNATEGLTLNELNQALPDLIREVLRLNK